MNRIHYACTECKRRKQKCNRQRPCQHCIARNIPERCQSHMQASESNEIESRLARIEQLLRPNQPGIVGATDLYCAYNRSTSHGVNRSATSQARSQTRERENVRARLSPETGLYNCGPTSHITTILKGLPGGPPEIAPEKLPVRSTGASSDINEVMSKYGQPCPTSLELLGALISREHCEALVAHYFDAIDWIYQPIQHMRVRKSLERFWDAQPQINVESINIFAALCGSVQ